MNTIKLMQGNALSVLKKLPSNSVHCCITSPPYYSIRDYGCEEQLGLEETWEEHIENLRDVFAEVRRVLHPSGTLWLNYDDVFSSAAGAREVNGDAMRSHMKDGAYPKNGPNRKRQKLMKDKDLMMLPFRLLIALHEDGWYFRCDAIWWKPNAQPSSSPDRPGRNHEYVFMLTKNKRYYYDKDGTRTLTGKEATWEEYVENSGYSFHDHSSDLQQGQQQKKRSGFKNMTHPLGAAMRSVLKHATKPSKDEEHWATYPPELISPLIKASTSDKGCCPKCLAPWVREYEELGYSDHGERHKRPDAPGAKLSKTSGLRTGKIKVKRPIGWKQDCKCEAQEPRPCVVLDCFSGTATTGLVAARMSRYYLGIELKQRNA